MALDILSRHAHELPPGLCIVVTSRFQDDIQDALQSPKAAGVDFLMEKIPTDLTVTYLITCMMSWEMFRI